MGNFDPDVASQLCVDFEKNVGTQIITDNIPVKTRQVQVMRLYEGRNIKHEIRMKDEDITTSTCFIYLEAG